MAIRFSQFDRPFGSPDTLPVHSDVIALHVIQRWDKGQRHNADINNLGPEILHLGPGILGENTRFILLPRKVQSLAHCFFNFSLFHMTTLLMFNSPRKHIASIILTLKKSFLKVVWVFFSH